MHTSRIASIVPSLVSLSLHAVSCTRMHLLDLPHFAAGLRCRRFASAVRNRSTTFGRNRSFTRALSQDTMASGSRAVVRRRDDADSFPLALTHFRRGMDRLFDDMLSFPFGGSLLGSDLTAPVRDLGLPRSLAIDVAEVSSQTPRMRSSEVHECDAGLGQARRAGLGLRGVTDGAAWRSTWRSALVASPSTLVPRRSPGPPRPRRMLTVLYRMKYTVCRAASGPLRLPRGVPRVHEGGA